MIKNMKKYGYIAFVLCVLAGCASQKQISYLQDVPDDYRQKITQDYDLRIHPDDLLSIMVNSKDPELAQMFNLPMVSYQIANSNTGYAGGQNRVLGYLVDKEGNIDFPQLGVIKVQGMTRAELTKYIKKPVDRKGTGKRSHRNHPVPELQSIGIGGSEPAGNIRDNQRPHYLAGRIEPCWRPDHLRAAREYKGCPGRKWRAGSGFAGLAEQRFIVVSLLLSATE